MFDDIVKLFNLGSDKANSKQYHDAMRSLVTILFAVVIGFGAQNYIDFNNIECRFDRLNSKVEFIVAILAVFLSWWGYHFGTIKGPKEINGLNFIIDIILLVVYWVAVSCKNSSPYIYFVMFFFYFLWEEVRLRSSLYEIESDVLRSARNCNLYYLTLIGVICIFYSPLSSVYWGWSVVVFFVIFIYRISIGNVYSRINDISKVYCCKVDSDYQKIVASSISVMKNSYSPLSGYKVGASVITRSGNIFNGTNIEFANYSNTIHAEESALSSMFSSGEHELVAIAVCTEGDVPVFPCGMCLQSLFEVGGPDLVVVACTPMAKSVVKKINELLPDGFRMED